MLLPLHVLQWQHLRPAEQEISRLWSIMGQPPGAGLVWLTGDSGRLRYLMLTPPGVICDPARLWHVRLTSKQMLHQSDDSHSGGGGKLRRSPQRYFLSGTIWLGPHNPLEQKTTKLHAPATVKQGLTSM